MNSCPQSRRYQGTVGSDSAIEPPQARKFQHKHSDVLVLKDELMVGLVCDIKSRSGLRRCDTGNREEKHRCKQSSPHEIILGKCDSTSKLLQSVDCRILNTATGAHALTIFTIQNCDCHWMTRQEDSAKCAEIRGILRLLDFHAAFACTTPAALPCECAALD